MSDDKTEYAVMTGPDGQRVVMRSMTAWRKAGRRVIDVDHPHAWRGKYADYAVYRLDQTEPFKRPTAKPPQVIDLMVALVEITRAAKRARDGARHSYEANAHGFAAMNRDRKEQLYDLKSQACAHLIVEGRLVPVEMHRIGGNYAMVYSPPGDAAVRLHVPCEPPPDALAANMVQDLGAEIEAKPRGKLRLKDAVSTIERYLDGRDQLEVYEWDAPLRPARVAECYECGGTWAQGMCMDCGRGR